MDIGFVPEQRPDIVTGPDLIIIVIGVSILIGIVTCFSYLKFKDKIEKGVTLHIDYEMLSTLTLPEKLFYVIYDKLDPSASKLKILYSLKRPSFVWVSWIMNGIKYEGLCDKDRFTTLIEYGFQGIQPTGWGIMQGDRMSSFGKTAFFRAPDLNTWRTLEAAQWKITHGRLNMDFIKEGKLNQEVNIVYSYEYGIRAPYRLSSNNAHVHNRPGTAFFNDNIVNIIKPSTDPDRVYTIISGDVD